jgi:hypothetical protein
MGIRRVDRDHLREFAVVREDLHTYIYPFSHLHTSLHISPVSTQIPYIYPFSHPYTCI